MNANELRINNLVAINNELLLETKGEIYKVSGINLRFESMFPDSKSVIFLDHTKSIRTYSQFDEFIEPIPLTEDWLLKMGFVYRGIYYHFPNHDIFKLEQYKNKNAYWLRHASESLDSVRINHVHTLQNLYFSLTGEELQLTN